MEKTQKRIGVFMRNLCDMDTIQIEITNACQKTCSNCTRFCGHWVPYYMSFDQFKEAVNSMVGYPKMVGIMGGDPLLHPEFEKFCDYLRSKIDPKQIGLWTGFPKGYEHYREVICKTFYNIFLNDHSRSDIYHHPPLVAVEEVIPDKNLMWQAIDHCWAQECWSASINPKGAFFCEIAASMSLLFGGNYDDWTNGAWKVEPGWWYRIPKDFKEQMEAYCPSCGFPVPLKRRGSKETVDDISPGNLKRLKGHSFKIDRGEYVVSDLKQVSDPEPLAAYKDFDYRNGIAKRYGMFLVINSSNFWSPYLYKEFKNG